MKLWTRQNRFTVISYLLLAVTLATNLVYNIRFAIWYKEQQPHVKEVLIREWIGIELKAISALFLVAGAVSLYIAISEKEPKRPIILSMLLHILAAFLLWIRLWVWII